MSKRLINYSPVDEDSEYQASVMIDKIVRISKLDQNTTLIHLITGEILKSKDSMKTLEARIELAD